jgi:thiol-disulfide isomerase/thioredoxin
MKKLFFLAAALLPSFVFAQTLTESFTVNGKIGTLNAPVKAYLFYQLGANKVVDSAMVVNGNFTITGEIIDPANAYLVLDHKGVGISKLGQMLDVLTLFVDKGTVTVTGKDSVYNAQITGSVINDENKKLTDQLKQVQDGAKQLSAEFQAAPKSQQNSVEFQNAMQAKGKALQEKQHSILTSFVVTHPDSYLSLLALNSIGGRSSDPAELEPLYNALSPGLKDKEAGKMLKKSIDESKIIAIGAVAPDFTQNDVNGVPVKLSSFRGKYVLIDFWASWCGPCRQENPNVVRIYNKYKNKNFTILGVSLDRESGKADWQNAIKSDGLTWTQVSDLKFWSNQAALLYFVGAIPSNFLLDPNGKIIAKDLRGSDLESKLSELLGKI